MDVVLFREYCLAKEHVTESLPFDEDTLVFKLNSKMFALTNIESGSSCNLKCDPEYAIRLREEFNAVQPGYHMNKKHWNTILFNSDASDSLIKELRNGSSNR